MYDEESPEFKTSNFSSDTTIIENSYVCNEFEIKDENQYPMLSRFMKADIVS
jgi:hypothetical protein